MLRIYRVEEHLARTLSFSRKLSAARLQNSLAKTQNQLDDKRPPSSHSFFASHHHTTRDKTPHLIKYDRNSVVLANQAPWREISGIG